MAIIVIALLLVILCVHILYGTLTVALSTYRMILISLPMTLVCSTATEKNSRKLLENFFYFKFDAVKDWSLEVSACCTCYCIH